MFITQFEWIICLLYDDCSRIIKSKLYAYLSSEFNVHFSKDTSRKILVKSERKKKPLPLFVEYI